MVPGRIWNPPLRAVGRIYTSHGRLLRRKRPRVVRDADLCGVEATSLSDRGACGGGRWTRNGCLFILPVCRGEHCSPASFTQQRISRKISRKKNGHGRAMLAPTRRLFGGPYRTMILKSTKSRSYAFSAQLRLYLHSFIRSHIRRHGHGTVVADVQDVAAAFAEAAVDGGLVGVQQVNGNKRLNGAGKAAAL